MDFIKMFFWVSRWWKWRKSKIERRTETFNAGSEDRRNFTT